jgi:hypothetical protein
MGEPTPLECALLRRAGMAIEWKTEVDAALQDAQKTNRPVLMDFTAAPL